MYRRKFAHEEKDAHFRADRVRKQKTQADAQSNCVVSQKLNPSDRTSVGVVQPKLNMLVVKFTFL
jgi:hypothetical protein